MLFCQYFQYFFFKVIKINMFVIYSFILINL